MIKIICFGKIKEKYLEDLCNDYFSRIKKYHKIEIVELKDLNSIEKETDSLRKVLKTSDYNIVLDIHGKTYDSVSFSKKIDNIFNYNSNITFIIGSSFGISEEIKKDAKELISFSSFTFPHGLFRGILLEQIYRSFKILNNEEYHK